jgi:hypothetical protein
MGINKENIHKVLGMLSNLYTNKASFIREWVSNAWDSHTKTNKKDIPVVFRVLQTSVQVEDFGTGMGPDVVNEIVANFTSTTKDKDAEAIGSYGIGIYSGYAWKDVFQLYDYYNGIKYHYLFAKEAGGYSILLLNEEETERENGCIFEIEVLDHYDIEREIEKLIYFDNVVFEGKDANIYNSYKVYNFKTFLLSSTSVDNDEELFMVLNQVKYKLDWEQLGISRIDFPIGIKVPQNEAVVPTPTREGIYYTPNSIALIKKCINDSLKELELLYNKQVKKPLELKEYLTSEYGILKVEGLSLNITNIIKSSLNDYKLEGLEWFERRKVNDWERYLLYPFKETYSLNGQKATKTYLKAWRGIEEDTKNLFLSTKNKSKSNINSHIRATKPNSYLYYTRRMRLWGSYKWAKDGYYVILHLKDFPRSEWRNKIIEYQKFINYVATTYFYDYDSIKVPKKTKITIKTALIGRVFPDMYNDHIHSGSWNKTEKVCNFLKVFARYRIIYSSDRDLLEDYVPVLSVDRNKLIHVSKKNEKMLDLLEDKTVINIKEKQKLLKPLMKGVARLLASKLFKDSKVRKALHSRESLVQNLNKQVHKDLVHVDDMIKKVTGYGNKEFLHSLLAVALVEGKIDRRDLEVINRLNKVIENYDQLVHITWDRYGHVAESVKVAEKVLRYDQIKERKRLLPYKNHK